MGLVVIKADDQRMINMNGNILGMTKTYKIMSYHNIPSKLRLIMNDLVIEIFYQIN